MSHARRHEVLGTAFLKQLLMGPATGYSKACSMQVRHACM